MKIEHLQQFSQRLNTPGNCAPHAVTEIMEIENLFRYTALAVGLKPSAMGCKARLRGLERMMYSKTIISVTA